MVAMSWVLRIWTRRLWIIVAVAAPLGLVVIGGCRYAGAKRAVVIDESRGTYGGVALGSSARDVRRAFGRGVSAGGFAPLGRLPAEVGVPPFLPNPSGAGQERPMLERFADAAFLLSGGRVFAMMVTSPRVRTGRGVAIGSSLADVKRTYGSARCSKAPGGETLTGSLATYPVCRIRLTRDRSLWFGGDPVRSFTFFSLEAVPVSAAVAMKPTTSSALGLCRRLSLIRPTCPTRVPVTRFVRAPRPPGFRGAAAGGAIALCADERLRGVPVAGGVCRYQSWILELGAPAGLPAHSPTGTGGPRLGPGRNRPPQYLHIIIYAARGTVANRLFPFAWPHGPIAARRNTLLVRKRAAPIALGRVHWGGHDGQLVLAPPLVFGGEVGDHLIYHWRQGGIEHVISVHAWAPLPEAVATLKLVAAKVRRVGWLSAERLVRGCRVGAVEQTHRRTVTLTLRTGLQVFTREPRIDDIVSDVERVRGQCPSIILATE